MENKNGYEEINSVSYIFIYTHVCTRYLNYKCQFKVARNACKVCNINYAIYKNRGF